MQSLLRAAARSGVRPMAAARGRAVRAFASAAPPAPLKYHLLEYKYVPDIVEKRGPYRAAHLEAAGKQLAAGKLVMGGAFGETPEGALFIFKDTTKEEIEAFIKADPYIKAGLVPSWKLKPYAVVVGK